MDFAAIVEGERPDLQKKLSDVWDRAADIGVANDAVISPAVIPFDEFGEYKSALPYYRNIEREGVRGG